MKIYFQVIVMDGCRVRAIGTKSSIEDADPELAAEWKIAASRQQDDGGSQRTARDRWSLIRLVSRIGFNVRDRRTSDRSWIVDRDAHVVNYRKSSMLRIFFFFFFNDRKKDREADFYLNWTHRLENVRYYTTSILEYRNNFNFLRTLFRIRQCLFL